MVILGTGEDHFERFFKGLQEEFPDRVAALITFNLGLASRIYAGGDIYMMPSKSEPCGLSQMNAMRYGTVPVVHATGGLKDTVPLWTSMGRAAWALPSRATTGTISWRLWSAASIFIRRSRKNSGPCSSGTWSRISAGTSLPSGIWTCSGK